MVYHLHHLHHLLLLPFPPDHLHANRNACHLLRIIVPAFALPLPGQAPVQQSLDERRTVPATDPPVGPFDGRDVGRADVRDRNHTDRYVQDVVQEDATRQRSDPSARTSEDPLRQRWTEGEVTKGGSLVRHGGQGEHGGDQTVKPELVPYLAVGVSGLHLARGSDGWFTCSWKTRRYASRRRTH